MNYKLIHNEQQLKLFIDFLPELNEDEIYFLTLIARRKWFPESTGTPATIQLKREVAITKDKIEKVIRQWEVNEGIYTYKDDSPIDVRNLGVYIGFNPKDQHKAIFELMDICLANIRFNNKNMNVKSMANSAIQVSNGTKNFIDIDVDIKENENPLLIIDFIKSIIEESALTFIKTSGGFHCLVRLSEIKSHTWYNKIKEHPFKSELNIMNNDLVPVVGCNQGQFVPHFINF